MHCLPLPEADTRYQPAFRNAAGATAWLAQQPQAQPTAMLEALREQSLALDAHPLPGAQALSLLNLLREAAETPLAALETRFLRKPLPLGSSDMQAFQASADCHLGLGLAFLRLAQNPGEPEALYRAVSALRSAQYVHFAAAQCLPPRANQLLRAALVLAQQHGHLTAPPGNQSISQKIVAHLIWALLLERIEPYRLSSAQLIVANRALGRWRVLTGFMTEAPADPRHACPIPQDGTMGGSSDTPWGIDLRPIRRKIAQRLLDLQNGATPDSLNLGRELSNTGCRNLLLTIEQALAAPPHAPMTETASYRLHYGSEDAYALLSGKRRKRGEDRQQEAIDHQRIALFGFDRHSLLPGKLQPEDLPGDLWTLKAGLVHRAANPAAPRLLSPCLVACRLQERNRLGLLQGLRATPGGELSGTLTWLPEATRCCLAGTSAEATRWPAFLLEDPAGSTLIAPIEAGFRPGTTLGIEGKTTRQLTLGDELQRGSNFVHFGIAG